MTAPRGAGLAPRRPRARVVFPAIAAFVALAAWPWSLPASLRADVEARIVAVTGHSARFSGNAVIAFLPYPRLTFEGLSVGAEGAPPLLTATSLRAAPRWGALLRGSLVTDDVLLVEPVLRLGELGRGGAGEIAGAALRNLAATLRGVAANADALGIERLRALRGRVVDADGSPEIGEVAGALRRYGDGRAAVAGSLRWRDATIALAVASPPPGAGVAEFTVSAPLGTIAFAGAVTGDDLVGGLRLASPDGRALARWLGRAPPPLAGPAGPEGFELTGLLTASPGRHALDEAVLLLASERYEGAVGLAFEGQRPALGATLAAARCDLGARLEGVFGALPPAIEPAGGWSRAPLPLPSGLPVDLDLRLSAARLALGPVVLDDAALTLALREGAAEIVLSEAAWRGGRAKGRLLIAATGDSIEAKGSVGVERAVLEHWALPRAPTLALTGVLTAQGTFEARGDSFALLASGLDGRGALALRPILLEGLDLARPPERDGGLDISRGRTAFGGGRLALRLHGGAAEGVEGASEAPGPRVVMTGRGDLPSRSLTVRAEVVGGALDRRTVYDVALGWDADGPKWSAAPAPAEPRQPRP